MTVLLEISQLCKRYGSRTAVDGLNLMVEEGAIFGFVGPNGAGKTSTLRMIATLLQITSGDIYVAGHSVRTDPRKVRQAIGYMPDFYGVYNDMSVSEYLGFFGACYQIPPLERAGLVRDLLELVDLSHRRDDRVDQLSRGMIQRLSLARTLIHDPQLLILDEPASGLDPRARVEIRELLVELAHMGKTIFFSTHILADVAEICTQVGIIEAGKLVAAGSLADLQQKLTPRRQVEIDLLERMDEARLVLSGVSGVIQVQPAREQTAGRQRLLVEFSGSNTELSQLLAYLVAQNFPVLQFHEQAQDLEEVFMNVTRGLVT
jgi:ABC-2 type transport system ATP-binding protein